MVSNNAYVDKDKKYCFYNRSLKISKDIHWTLPLQPTYGKGKTKQNSSKMYHKSHFCVDEDGNLNFAGNARYNILI